MGAWPASPSPASPAPDESAVGALYRGLLASWNARDPRAFAALFGEDGHVIGFDGSPVDGRAEIEAHLRRIFADHPTGRYVGKLRGLRFPTPDVAILRAVAGMVPPGQVDLNPAVNAMQTLVAARLDGRWHIALYQNTPAQFHGRPELARQLTDELRQLL
jgi:uncharacterized protein (TIGR02246 family)